MLIECEDDRLGMKVVDVYDDRFLMTRADPATDRHHIVMRFSSSNFTPKVPETARELSVSPSLRVLKDRDSCYLLKGDSIVHLDLRNSRAEGSLGTSFWESPPKSQQELLMLSLLWLMRNHGLYGLHANGLEKNGCGVLIAGSTCSGKSTAAVSLIRQGWRYLSDDVTLLRQSRDRIEAIAFQRGFSIDPGLARHYQELEEPLRTSSSNGHKRLIDLNAVYPGKHVSQCIPNVLIFPSIVSEKKSQLIPLDTVAALIELSQNCGGIFVDRDMVAVQMEVLKRLVCQSSSYQLLAGRDLHEEPWIISDILSEAVGHNGRDNDRAY